MRVLVVENDDRMARALTRALRGEHFTVERAVGVLTATEAIDRHEYAVALVDLGLDDGDGVDVIRMLRDHAGTGVIAVTARGAELDRVRGLRAGADDYLVKPFGRAELMARIEAVTRRLRVAQTSAPPQEMLSVGPVTIDRSKREVTVDDTTLTVTPKEFDILTLLMLGAGAVVERDRILDQVWQSAAEGASRTLDTHMASLRSKLSPSLQISTIRGVGFRLEKEHGAVPGGNGE